MAEAIDKMPAAASGDDAREARINALAKAMHDVASADKGTIAGALGEYENAALDRRHAAEDNKGTDATTVLRNNGLTGAQIAQARMDYDNEFLDRVVNHLHRTGTRGFGEAPPEHEEHLEARSASDIARYSPESQRAFALLDEAKLSSHDAEHAEIAEALKRSGADAATLSTRLESYQQAVDGDTRTTGNNGIFGRDAKSIQEIAGDKVIPEVAAQDKTPAASKRSKHPTRSSDSQDVEDDDSEHESTASGKPSGLEHLLEEVAEMLKAVFTKEGTSAPQEQPTNVRLATTAAPSSTLSGKSGSQEISRG